MTARRVVITGLGVVSPAGVGADAFWHGVTTGAETMTAAPVELKSSGANVVAGVKAFSGAAFLRNERHRRIFNRTVELLVGAGALAAEHAKLHVTPIPPLRLGVVVGIGPIDPYTDDLLAAVRDATVGSRLDLEKFAQSSRAMYPLRRLRLIPNIGAALLSIEHHAMGPSLTLVSGHLSGLQAIGEGLAMIRDGRVDAVLCGGADSRFTPLGLRLFGDLCPMSSCEEPRLACRPFDRDRRGVVPGEGAAIVVLEAEDSAIARGVDAGAELVTVASATRAGGGCVESMRLAMHGSADRSPGVVVAHGEGGVESDGLEAAALVPMNPRCVTSLQSAVGHTMSACGAMNVAGACLMLSYEHVPSIRTLESPDVNLPFAMHDVRGAFTTALVNALAPDGAASSARLARA